MDRANPRGSPLFSGLGIAIGILFLIGFGVTVWFTGGSLFSPGPVSAKSKPGVTYRNFNSHADFENQCDYCHQPLQSSQSDVFSTGDVAQVYDTFSGQYSLDSLWGPAIEQAISPE